MIGATANGRKAHIPVSEGISPEKSADVNGPTAVIKSCAKMDHLATAGTLLNQKFTPDVVAGEKGLEQYGKSDPQLLCNGWTSCTVQRYRQKDSAAKRRSNPEDYKRSDRACCRIQ